MNKEITKINFAYDFAREKHVGQLDDSGGDYFIKHCYYVGQTLEHYTRNINVIMAGYLHDTLEDTNTTFEDLKENFGEEVAKLVYMVTHEGKKDTGYYFPNLKLGKLNNGLIASQQDLKNAMLIKFTDRLSNLSRMDSWSKNRINHYLKKSQFWKIGVDNKLNQDVGEEGKRNNEN